MAVDALARSAHLVATVSLVGYYVVLALVVLPALVAQLGEDASAIVAAIERRAMPVLVGSGVVFLVTGVYLLTSDARYGGAGNVNGDWASLLLIKHLAILAMLVLGSYVDGLIVRAAEAGQQPGPAAAMARIRLGVGGMAALGLIVVLLTAAAQAA